MKIVSLIFFAILMSKGCENQKDAATAIIEYTANTRGFYERITITDKEVSVSSDRNATDLGLTSKLSDSDRTQISEYFGQIDLENLSNLKAPTEKRFYDGAAIANLKITYDGKTYESQAFDHGTPPAEIAGLVNKINEFSQRK